MNDNDKARRVKRAAYQKAYYSAHREEATARMKAWYATHREKQKVYRKAYNAVHREEHRAYMKAYNAARREEQKAYMKAWYATHRGEITAYKEAHKNEIAAYDAAYRAARLKTDLDFKLTTCLRNRVNIAVRNNQKAGSAVRDLGCTIPEFKNHIERQFKEGMTWDNWGEWHLDHICPLASFDLTNREQFLQAAHYTNYQPLWASENVLKGANI